MATPAEFKTGIGTIQVTMGAVRIVDSTGYVRNALEGERVDLHDTIIAGGDAFIQVRLDNGRVIDVTHDSTLVLEASVVGPEPAAAPTATPADVATLQAAIAAGADPSQIAQATAAGAPGAGGAEGGGGHTFVVLEQANTAGEVTAGFPTAPASIVYPTLEPEPLPVVEGETLPEALPVVSVTARVAEGVELPPAGGTTPGIDVKAATVLEGTGPHEGGEGHLVYFTLHLDKPFATDVEVTYTIRPGTAQFPADFTEGDLTLTHTVVIPAGTTELAVPVTITGDHLVEPNETFDIVLVSATNGTIDAEGNRATVTIVDDDAAPIALPDTNWAQEDLVNATGNVLQDLAHGGAPRGVFADVADIDFETLAVASVNGASVNVGQAVAGAYGTLTLDANGAYDYVPDVASYAVQNLDDGETLTEAFSYTVTDGYNAPASATLTITVFGTNDAPVAHSDTNWVLEDGDAAVGNVLQNLAHPGAPSGLHADVADTDLDEEALSVSTTGSFAGTFGTLVLNEDGSYRYTLDHDDPAVQVLAAGDRLTDTFNYIATDGTDSAPASLTISIFGTNDAPVIGSSSARVSEEGLAGGIPDTTGSIDTTNAATAIGAIAVSDLDQDALAITLSAPETALYSNGVPLQWAGEGSSTLVGSAAGRPIVTITIDDTGAYAVTLSGPLDHADETAEDEALFTVGVYASDGTATVRGTLDVTVEDDAPRVTLTGLEPALAVDESVLSADASADFSGAFATAFGADSAGSVRYGLNIAGGNGVDSGLDDSVTGQSIVLVLNGNAVEGHVGNATGALAFTITLDETHGLVGLDQLRAVMHASADSPDTSEPASIAAGLVNLVATAVDADGDRHAASLDIGRRVSFLDDGPAITTTGAAAALLVDETLLATDTDTADFAAAFSAVAGADTASVSYRLGLGGANGIDSGLDDSATGQDVVLVLSGNAVEGRVGSTTGPLAFTLTLEGSRVTLDQMRALLHGSPDAGTDANEPVSLDRIANLVTLAATITDADGDTATASIDLGRQVSFLDDGPAIAATGAVASLAVDETLLATDTDSADFSGAFAATFGADSAGSVRYGLNVVGGNGADSGLDDSLTGQSIVLVLNGNMVEGRVGSTSGPIAFTASLDEATGIVTLDQVRAVMHPSPDSPDISEPVSIVAGVLKLVATATDADGDTVSAAIDLGRTISFLDDGPSVIVPASAHVANAAAATFSGALDFDRNVDDNAGADQRASVTFDAAQDGKDSGLTSGGSPIYLYVSDSGKTLTGSTAMSEAGVTTENTVFALAINQDAGPGVANDYYTVTMTGVVDNGAGVVFSDLSGTGPAGNPAWKVVESGEEGRDILFTPVAPATSVNSDSDDVGVDSQFIDYGKGLRIDFADFAVTGKAQSIDYSFGPSGHYTVNHFSFGINEIANGTVADITLRAYNADEDDPITATLTDDAQSHITQVRVYDGADRLVAAASDDATLGGIEFDFDVYPSGGVTVRGLQEGYSVVTISNEGYDRLEIVNAGSGGEDGKFSLNQLEVLSIDTGSPVDTSFQLDLTDADGDSASALINVTFEPTGGEEMPLSGSDAALYGAEAASAQAVDLHATLQSLVPHATSAADYDGYVALDSQSAPGHTIVMVDPTGSGNYQPLVTLTDVASITLQELLDQHQVLAA